MKLFDYKFLILLGLTLVVYFLYREVEVIKNKLKKYDDKLIEDRQDDEILQIELPPNPDDNKVEKVENLETDEIKNIDLKPNNVTTKNVKSNEENIKKVINIPLNLNKDLNKKVEENNQNNTTSSNSEAEINVYSNTSEKLEIYSNDDEEDNDSSIIISLEEIPKKKHKMESSERTDNRLNDKNNLEINDSEEIKDEVNENNEKVNEENNKTNDKTNETNEIDEIDKINEIDDIDQMSENNQEDEDNLKSSINNLLKNNKLAELQDQAKSLGIIITKKEKNKNKNKTKLELANDIVNKKLKNENTENI